MLKSTRIVIESVIYGPTDFSDDLVSELNGKTIFRSDYLDKLKEALASDNPEEALASDNPEYKKTFSKLPGADIRSANGYDADHPFVTHENGKFRAWRYVAVK